MPLGTDKDFDGKEQYYFLADFLGDESSLDIATHKPEFRALRWIAPWEFDIGWLPANKQEVYKTVIKDFFGADIASV